MFLGYLHLMDFKRLLIVPFLLACFSFLAQTTYQVPVQGQISGDFGVLSGVQIQVFQGSTVWKTLSTDAGGNYSFELPLNSEYMVVISKAGMASKKFSVSTRGIPAERATNKFSIIDADIGLYEKIDGVDYSVLNQPLNKYVYNPTKENMEFDEAYLNQMLGALGQLKAAIDAAIKAKKELEANYQAAMKAGDKAFNKRDWTGAKAAYTEASNLKPKEQYPKDQIANINKIIADQEALNKKNEDAAKKAAEEAAKKKAEDELNAKYLAAVKKGDDAFAKKDWATAKGGYNEALGIKSMEMYPKMQLAEIEKALAAEAAAKAKQEGDAKAKAELEAKYAAAIKKGDEAFAKKDWVNAKAGYNEAIGLKSTEVYPKNQLAAIDKAIADEAAAKAKTEADAKAKAELDAKYAAAVKKGDDAFAKKDWVNAKAGYNEALTIKSSEAYPKNQLAAIDKAIADDAAAKAKLEADAKAKAELEAKYLAAIKKGDDAFSKKDWTNARVGYNEALGLKANEQYPKDKLAAIDKAIADEKASMDAAAKAKAEAELNAKYLAAVKKGDDAFAKKDWVNAKAGYNEALGLKPNEKYPKDQLAAIDKVLGDEAAAKAKAEADAKAKAELEAKYLAAIKKGDEDFAKKDWTNSRAAYTEALGLKPTEVYPKNQIAAIDKALGADAAAKAKAEAEAKAKAELEAKYLAAVKKGDDNFAKKDWTNAKAGYNEALGIKPAEAYPKNQLAAIDKAIAEEAADKLKNANDAKAKAELEAKYLAAIKKGDDAFAKKDWLNAKSAYTEALVYKSGEQYPKDKIAAIDKAMADEIAVKTKTVAETKTVATTGNDNERKYQDAVKRGDSDFSVKKYKDAKADFEEALVYKPGDVYAKDKLIDIEKLMKSDNTTAANVDERIKALLAKYPPGVTEETINGPGVVIIQRVVVKENNAWVYQKKIFNWGGIAYFRDNSPITELIFEHETKP